MFYDKQTINHLLFYLHEGLLCSKLGDTCIYEYAINFKFVLNIKYYMVHEYAIYIECVE